jgi:hypothetical protein
MNKSLSDIEAKIEALPKGYKVFVSPGDPTWLSDLRPLVELTTDDLKTLASQLADAKQALEERFKHDSTD